MSPAPRPPVRAEEIFGSGDDPFARDEVVVAILQAIVDTFTGCEVLTLPGAPHAGFCTKFDMPDMIVAAREALAYMLTLEAGDWVALYIVGSITISDLRKRLRCTHAAAEMHVVMVVTQVYKWLHSGKLVPLVAR